MIDCCQTRGSAWLIRDITYPGAFGSDNDIERSYFADFLTENSTYYPLWLAFKDGPGSTNYRNSITPPDHLGAPTDVEDTFIESYVGSAAYNTVTFQHSPFGGQFAKQNALSWQATLGAQLPNPPVGYYTIDFNLDFAIHNGDCNVQANFGAAVGPCYNGTDASDFGAFSAVTSIGTGGQLTNNRYDMSAGGTLKNMNGTLQADGAPGPIDQLVGTNWYTMIGPYGPGGASFYVQCSSADHTNFPTQCPVAGQAFTDFTRSGVSIAGETGEQFKYRPLLDPGPGNGFADFNYEQNAGQNINGLHILGYDVTATTNNFNTRSGGAPYNPTLPSYWWDASVVVPGLPSPSGVFDNSGTPWTFTSLVPAINYNLGGQGVGFNQPTGHPCNSAEMGYRADCINFKPNVFSGSPAYQLGYSAAAGFYSYSINVGSAVSSVVNMQLADASAGGSWTVQIDGSTVATVTTPNTGSYDNFEIVQSTAFTPTVGPHTLTFLCNGGDLLGACGDFLTWQGGPSSVSPPAEAAAAGFTTLAANYDFSQPLYAVQSNWLDCTNTNASVAWHQGSPGLTGALPCNINQATDPSTGGTVLDLKYLASYVSTYGQTGNNNYVTMQTVTKGGDQQGGTVTASFPYMYVESVYRIDQTYGTGGNTSGPDGVWDWQTTLGVSGDQPLEFDYGELYGSSNGFGDAGIHNWGNTSPPAFWISYTSSGCPQNCQANIPAGWGPTAYHKYGALLTSDGGTSVWGCSFIDDVFQSCVNANAISPQYNNRNWLIAWIGSNNAGPLVDTNLYIEYIHVWSCSNWATQSCKGSTLTGSGGTTLTYWH